ncbi:MAG: Crp/Fnr family transcriptional regulator [Jaaginema sp. PMC 1079.18]|nr:Crp/Fnr family transcriptional regulator [Jaaginema sp. PMC 1080.18]MEC4850757.1 Crp/Fnr family transcriptional regulator [Jaaginema sp. PMC 1079.18]MEC4865337.1 Crp/Fnr family transcriptional regulator [Jaaginema sp. PMC 1078.18]
MSLFNVPINQLLSSLSPKEYQVLEPHLEEVSLPLGKVLYELSEPIEFVYFPNHAMVSLVSIMENGATTEVGMIGNDGMVGIPVFLGGNSTTNRAVVQIAGSAMRMDANILKTNFRRGGELQQILLLYTQAFLTQVSQTATCNRLHSLEERLARWLLLAHDCALKDELLLTQEYIANMLGTRRASVTVAAGLLQQSGLIQYSRGKIKILNRSGLQTSACECYNIVKEEHNRLLA